MSLVGVIRPGFNQLHNSYQRSLHLHTLGPPYRCYRTTSNSSQFCQWMDLYSQNKTYYCNCTHPGVFCNTPEHKYHLNGCMNLHTHILEHLDCWRNQPLRLRTLILFFSYVSPFTDIEKALEFITVISLWFTAFCGCAWNNLCIGDQNYLSD